MNTGPLNPIWSHLAYALLHSLWQAGLLSLILLLCLKVMPPTRGEQRYRLTLATLLLVPILFLCTWHWLNLPQEKIAQEPNSGTETSFLQKYQLFQEGPAPAPASPGTARMVRLDLPWPAWLLLVWLTGFVIMLIRSAQQWSGLQRLCRESRPVKNTAAEGILDELKRKLGLNRRVLLCESSSVEVPCVLGLFLPAILFPASMASGLPASQLRAILAHELVHVRRYDFLLQFFQTVIESLFYFNPFVWWMSRQVRMERESSCDFRAAELCGGTVPYAEAITSWLGVHSRMSPAGSLGLQSGNSWLERMRRMLIPGYRPEVKLPWSAFVGALFMCSLTLALFWQGTHIAVSAAAAVLTPEQRVEKISTLKKNQEFQSEAFTLSGMVLDDQERPLSGNHRGILLIVDEGENQSAKTFHDFIVSSGFFQHPVSGGVAYLYLQVPEYAPLIEGPLRSSSIPSPANLILKTSRGFPVTVQVEDKDGISVDGASIRLRYALGHQNFFSGSTEALTFTTDVTGKAIISNACDRAAQITVHKKGYVDLSTVVDKMGPGKPLRLVLQPGSPIRGQVVSKVTGEPLPGATIRAREMATLPLRAKILAMADEHGRFEILDLQHGQHALWALADDHAPELIDGVQAGTSDLRILLGPELIVSGKITGDLNQVGNSITLMRTLKADTKYGTHVPLTFTNGEAHFSIRDSWKGTVELIYAGKRKVLDLATPVTNLALHIPERKAESPRLVRFEFPQASPSAVNGTIRIFQWQKDSFERQSLVVGITNGTGEFSLQTPGYFNIDQAFLPGWALASTMAEVESGTAPFVYPVSVVPGGAIKGKVFTTKHHRVSISLVSLEKSPLLLDHSHPSTMITPSDDPGWWHFQVHGIPLGGRYQVVAYAGMTFSVSPAHALTESAPVAEVTLELPKGNNLQAQLLSPEGSPLPGIQLKFLSSLPSHSWTHAMPPTDGEGKLTLEGLNPNWSGKIFVESPRLPGFQRSKWEIDPSNNHPKILQLKPGATIRGQVLDSATGHPVQHADVYAVKGTLFEDADQKSDPSGRFEFTTLEEGEWEIGVRNASTGFDHRRRGRTGQKEPVIVRIIPMAGSEARGVEAAPR